MMTMSKEWAMSMPFRQRRDSVAPALFILFSVGESTARRQSFKDTDSEQRVYSLLRSCDANSIGSIMSMEISSTVTATRII
jgi:hypothetical protein